MMGVNLAEMEGSIGLGEKKLDASLRNKYRSSL